MLAPVQERSAIELRKLLELWLDDLLVVVREFLNPTVSRAGPDRCLAYHGVGKLRDFELVMPTPCGKSLKDYAPGFAHVDVK